MGDGKFDALLDASGLSCPLPLLKAKQALNRLDVGKVLKVIATDAGSVRDFKVFTEQSDHDLIETFTGDDEYIYWIRRG